MALTQVNSTEAEAQGPSKLDNAAKILGLMLQTANTGISAYKSFGSDSGSASQPNMPAQTATDSAVRAQDLNKSIVGAQAPGATGLRKKMLNFKLQN